MIFVVAQSDPPKKTTAGWGFAGAFAAFYCALYVGYSTIPDDFLREIVYYHGIVCPSKAIIDWLAPSEHVIGAHNILRSSATELRVVRGCDGAGFIFLMVAALLAFRTGWRRTLFGILGAFALMYILNQLRIVTIYFLNAHRPDWFTPAHVYFIPTFMIVAGAIYFVIWSAPTRDAPSIVAA